MSYVCDKSLLRSLMASVWQVGTSDGFKCSAQSNLHMIP